MPESVIEYEEYHTIRIDIDKSMTVIGWKFGRLIVHIKMLQVLYRPSLQQHAINL